MIVKTKEQGFARDTSSHALLNTSVNALEAHKANRRSMKQVDRLETEVATMRATLERLMVLLESKG